VGDELAVGGLEEGASIPEDVQLTIRTTSNTTLRIGSPLLTGVFR
jgi:hypothetical protein